MTRLKATLNGEGQYPGDFYELEVETGMDGMGRTVRLSFKAKNGGESRGSATFTLDPHIALELGQVLVAWLGREGGRATS